MHILLFSCIFCLILLISLQIYLIAQHIDRIFLLICLISLYFCFILLLTCLISYLFSAYLSYFVAYLSVSTEPPTSPWSPSPTPQTQSNLGLLLRGLVLTSHFIHNIQPPTGRDCFPKFPINCCHCRLVLGHMLGLHS